jgi:2-isopropylmalate synthase
VALVDDQLAHGHDRIQVVSLRVVAGTFGPPSAELELAIDGQAVLGVARGDGPVDAIFNAVKVLFPHAAILRAYDVHAVTEGTDAQAGVSVRLEDNGRTVLGTGAHTDTLVASAKAYVHALNRLQAARLRAGADSLTTAHAG